MGCYQVNRTTDGYLVLLVSTRGVDKAQSGVARVDRRAIAHASICSRLALKSVKEYTEPRELPAEQDSSGRTIVHVSVPAGELLVVGLQIR